MAALGVGLALGVALGGVLVAKGGPRKVLEGPGRSKLGFEAKIVAHRGGAGERIENTLEAFEHAVQEGAELLELDVRRSQDGVVVVSHDRELLRQCGVDIDIARTNYQDLPPYRCPLEVTFSPGHFSSGRDLRIPRLVEVFERFPEQPISIEVKDDDDDLINEVASLVRRFDRAEITLWASFREPILRKCRKAHPGMPFAFSLSRGLKLLLFYHLGLLPWVTLGESALLFCSPSIINRTYFPVPRGWAGDLLRRVVRAVALPLPLLQELRRRGIQVWLWVLNEDCDFAEAFGLGASGVVTDYPSRLRKFLEGSGCTSELLQHPGEKEGQGETKMAQNQPKNELKVAKND